MKLKLFPALALVTLTPAASAQNTPDTLTTPETPSANTSTAKAPAEPVSLRLKLEEGVQYNLRIVSKQKVSQTIIARRMDIGIDLKLGMAMRVISVDDEGVMAIDTRYTSMAITTTVSSPGEKTFTVSYDTDRPNSKADPNFKMFSAFIGQSMTIKMSPTGAITAVEGLDKLWQNVVARMPTPKGVTRAAFEKSMAPMKEQLSEKNVRHQLSALALYPSNPVSIGESWSNSTSMNVGFPITTKTKYTLQKVDQGLASIGMNSTLTATPGAAPRAPGLGPNIKFRLTGNMGGTITANAATGLTQKAAIDYRFNGTISMPHPEEPGKTMTWPLYSKGTTLMEYVPVNTSLIPVNTSLIKVAR